MQTKETSKIQFDPVLEFVFARIEPDMALLRYTISLLNPGIQERFIYALAKIYNPLEMIANLPEHSKVRDNNSDHDFLSFTAKEYNFLEDEVRYTSEVRVYRHFKNEEDAKHYSETGEIKCAYGDWEWGRKPSDTKPFVGSWVSKESGTCSYDTWMRNQLDNEEE